MKNASTLRLFLMTVLLALTAGTAWAETAVLPATQAITTTPTYVGTDTHIKIMTSSANTYTSPLRMYANVTITITADEGYQITSVVYESSQTGNYVTNAQKATVSPIVIPTVSGKEVTWEFPDLSSAVTEFTFKPSAQTRCNSITINYQATGTSTKTGTTTSFGTASYNFTLNSTEYNAFTGQTAIVTDGTDPLSEAAVVYTTTDSKIAAVDENSGAITLGTKLGTATITATYAGNDNFYSSQASYTITVTYPYVHAGTEADPFTVAEAIAKAQEIGKTTDGVTYYTTGTISQIDTYGNNTITYWISDDGTTNNQLEVYKGKGLEGANFVAISDLAVGYDVVISGNLVNYNEKTPEYAANSQIVSLDTHATVEAPIFSIAGGTYTEAQSVEITAEDGTTIYYTTNGNDPVSGDSDMYSTPIQITAATMLKAIAVDAQGNASPVTSASYVIKPNAPVFTNPEGTYPGSVELKFTIPTSGINVIYTLDGSAPSLDNDAAVIYKEAITLTATTTVKAVAVDNYNNYSNVITATYTITDENSRVATYNFTDAKWIEEQGYAHGNKVNSWPVGNVVIGGDKGKGSTDPAYYTTNGGNLRTYTNGRFVVASTDGTPITSIVIECSGTSYAKITLPEEQPGSFVLSGNTYTWTPNAASDVVSVTFSGNGTSRISTITVTTKIDVTVTKDATISAAGYATFYTEQPIEVPAGMTAGIISAASDPDENGIATLTIDWNYSEGAIVPAATPLIIKGEAGNYTCICKGTTAAVPADNMLMGSAVATTTTGGDKFFMLSYGKDDKADVLGFFYGAAEGAAFESEAGKCWLAVDAAAGIRGFVFDTETLTGINKLNATANGQAIYDLQGRRVNAPEKGVYIINGKKVLVK